MTYLTYMHDDTNMLVDLDLSQICKDEGWGGNKTPYIAAVIGAFTNFVDMEVMDSTCNVWMLQTSGSFCCHSGSFLDESASLQVPAFEPNKC